MGCPRTSAGSNMAENHRFERNGANLHPQRRFYSFPPRNKPRKKTRGWLRLVDLKYKGDLTNRHTFLLIIAIGQLRATADVYSDIGRSSQLDHSKALDVYFSELHWSTFLDPVEKDCCKNKTARRVCMFSHGRRISARKSAFHHTVATNDRYLGTVL